MSITPGGRDSAEDSAMGENGGSGSGNGSVNGAMMDVDLVSDNTLEFVYLYRPRYLAILILELFNKLTSPMATNTSAHLPSRKTKMFVVL